MAEANGSPEGDESSGGPLQILLNLGIVVAAFVTVDWLAPPGAPLRAGVLAAVPAFLLAPVFGLGGGSAAALAARAAVSLALAALAGAIVWLATESRTVLMAIALYFVLWWTLLFAVLPWGVRSQHEAEEITPGSDPGAPVAPFLFKKVLATSVVAALVLGVVLLFLYLRPIPNILPFA